MRSEKPFPGAAQPEVNLPETLATPTFIGFVSTQFLGAFNDNYFKQLVLLACVNEAATTGNDRQPVALAAFALPFVLLSGFGGYLSDRFSRQRTIIWCKVAEIAIMALALGVLLIPGISQSTQLMLLIGVLAFMGGQSAVFGPSKYGSLPELFRPEQLLMVNGIVQMTTFLAIIFGVVCAGIALDYLDRSLWPGSTIAVGIAIAGTLTSTLIRRTFAANPNLPLRAENLAMPREVWELLKRRPSLLQAILVATVFWFVGGVAQPAVNTLGRVSMGLSETRASMLTAAIGIGIAAGCILVGLFASKAGATWVMRGAWGMIGTLFAISLLGSQATPPENNAGMVIMRPSHKYQAESIRKRRPLQDSHHCDTIGMGFAFLHDDARSICGNVRRSRSGLPAASATSVAKGARAWGAEPLQLDWNPFISRLSWCVQFCAGQIYASERTGVAAAHHFHADRDRHLANRILLSTACNEPMRRFVSRSEDGNASLLMKPLWETHAAHSSFVSKTRMYCC